MELDTIWCTYLQCPDVCVYHGLLGLDIAFSRYQMVIEDQHIWKYPKVVKYGIREACSRHSFNWTNMPCITF